MINATLCMMVVSIRLRPFILLSVTLTAFQRAAWENELCPNVLVFMCEMRRALESDEERSRLDGE